MQSKQTNIRITDKVNPPNGRLSIAAVNQKVETLHQEVVELKNIVLAFISEQRKFNQYVLDMFKKHKWIK